jgi:hypothetical protein
MTAQYGKIVMRDVIQPWAETMVSNAASHPAGAGGIEKVNREQFFVKFCNVCDN